MLLGIPIYIWITAVLVLALASIIASIPISSARYRKRVQRDAEAWSQRVLSASSDKKKVSVPNPSTEVWRHPAALPGREEKVAAQRRLDKKYQDDVHAEYAQLVQEARAAKTDEARLEILKDIPQRLVMDDDDHAWLIEERGRLVTQRLENAIDQVLDHGELKPFQQLVSEGSVGKTVFVMYDSDVPYPDRWDQALVRSYDEPRAGMFKNQNDEFAPGTLKRAAFRAARNGTLERVMFLLAKANTGRHNPRVGKEEYPARDEIGEILMNQLVERSEVLIRNLVKK